jgi:hypothetical protein
MSSLRKTQQSNAINNSFKKLKYLGINLMKEVKKLCNKNYKSQRKKSMRTLKDRTSHVHGSAEPSIMKMVTLLKPISTFNAVSIKIPMTSSPG